MSIYQVKLKGKEGLMSYHTFLARDVEDTIKQALVDEEKHPIKDIEKINELHADGDIKEIVRELEFKLGDTFRDLRLLAQEGADNCENGPDIAELVTFMDLVKVKTDQIYSIMNALYEIDELPKRFGYKRES